jgi:hypothetical protein
VRVQRDTIGSKGGILGGGLLGGLLLVWPGTVAAHTAFQDVAPLSPPLPIEAEVDAVSEDSAAAADLAWSAHFGGVLAAGAFDAPSVEPEALVGAVWAGLGADLLFDNQVSVGVQASLTAFQDHPRTDPRGDALAGAAPGFRSVHKHLAEGGARADMGPRLNVEAAYVYARGPLGELRVGRDSGYAATVAAAPAFAPISLGPADAGLDLTGLGSVVTADQLSGTSTKVSARTARVLGLDLGVSYTPTLEAWAPGTTRRYGPAGVVGAIPDSIWEAGASLELQPPAWDVGIVGAATLSNAAGPTIAGVFEDVETVTANLGLRGRDWYLAAAGLRGDNGWSGPGDRDYQSISVQAGVALPDFNLGLEMAGSTDDLIATDLKTAMISMQKPFEGGHTLTLGLQHGERESGLPTARRTERAFGVFAEWTFDWRSGAN